MNAPDSSLPQHKAFFAVLILFFLSGVSGLVYEVIWIRLLTHIFGTTTFAVSALLATFMAGLGLGSYLSGRWLVHRGQQLVWFGSLEIMVGIYAVCLPWLLPIAEGIFINATAAMELSMYGENLLKVLLALVVLLPPTTFMGATLPLLCQHSIERMGHLGLRVGSLYALNTLGAAVGCFLAGFYAIPTLGVSGTTWAAVAVNLTVGTSAIALGAGRRFKSTKSDPLQAPPPPEQPHPVASTYPRRTLVLVVAAFALSGFAALGLEVVWTRMFNLIFVGFTYSFSSMLTVFLLGLALGSLVLSRRADRSEDPLRLFGLLEMAIAIMVLAPAPLFVEAQGWINILGLMLGGRWEGFAIAKFAVAFVILFSPTFLFGATFPVVSRIVTRNVAGLGGTIGRVYAANVAGGIAGAFTTGFFLVPFLGTQTSLCLLSLILLVMGMTMVAMSPRWSFATKGISLALAAIMALASLQNGPPDISRAIHESWLNDGERISFYKEGAGATVMVAEARDPDQYMTKRILVNGSSASNSSFYGLSVNRIQGCLPFLFERMPRKVLAICFGTGITFGTLTQFDVERVDGVDISPEVIEAAPRFREENYDVVGSPKIRIHIDDGRNFLFKSRIKYDAITMEPMPPALAGVVDFYTREFYELCREHLERGGVVSQWVPLYYLGPDDVKMLYRTFAESFPHAMVFIHEFDTFMVGSDRPLDLSWPRFSGRLHSDELRRDLESINLSMPEQFLGTYLMDRAAMLRLAGEAPILTDDMPFVEFTAPKWDFSFLAPSFLALTAHAQPASLYLSEDTSPLVREALDKLHRDNALRWKMARDRAEELRRSVTGGYE